ncbi:WD40-repeat-containing domain protein [Crassisporium funariophilum]|nr:WD40-repeat-containing domain protein [Crassisporium funariophilum]
MFATTTTDALSVADPSSLKKAPSSIPSCLDLLQTPTASFWSPDNAFLYLSSAHTIHRYDASSNTLKDMYTCNDGDPIQHLVSRDRTTVIFATGDKIHLLECTSIPKVSQTLESHKTAISSLSLSNDSTLLASTSSTAVHVHNLTLGSHSVLRGLTSGGQDITTSIFHPHSRTRLLVAAGKQLMIYDTTRPSGPVKTIAMTESTSGDITAIACSPFSKTLVAAATSGGFVGLIDLEKDKALFRILNLKVPITTIGFSPEGAAIYLGTENGKILVVDLRALDKPPKAVVVSESGNRIETMSIQKKVKSGIEGSTRTPAGSAATTNTKTPSDALPSTRRTTSNTVLQTARSASKAVPSPARQRVTKPVVTASPVSRRVASSAKEGIAPSSTVKRATTTETKKVFSPVRDPHGNSGSVGDISVQLDDLANLRRGKIDTTPIKISKKASTDTLRARPSPSPRAAISAGRTRAPTTTSTTDSEAPRRARTLPTTTNTTASSSRMRKTSTSQIAESASAGERLAVPQASPQLRTRAESSASRAGSEAISVVPSSNRAAKAGTSSEPSASRPSSSASRPESSSSRVSRTRGGQSPAARRPVSSAVRMNTSRTPSPDLPGTRMDPVTPVPAQKLNKQKSGMHVLGLGTPEVDRWIRAGQEDQRKKREPRGDTKGKGKTVGFQDEDEEMDHDERAAREARERSLTMQVSPRRPTPSSTAASWAASPALNPGNGVPGTPGSSSAHELLKTIVQDVMYDFQRDTKAEMVGLHLDLVRMGRGWKTELRELMDEYVGDLRDLREENQRLRLENDRLRKGY